jgi:hypothetical protein
VFRKIAVCIVCAASLFLRAQDQIQTGTGVSVSNAAGQLAQPGFISAKSEAAIDAATQSQVSETLGKDEPSYHFTRQPRGFAVENSKHGLLAEFTPSGANLRSGNNHWSIALRGYGYGSKLMAANEVMPRANANRLQYLRAGLTEWYVNGPLGLEQGFTLAQAPAKSNGEPLTLAFTLSGDLSASVDSDARGLTLKKNGSTVLRYGGLVATDASGRDLPTWLEVAQNELQLQVDDRGAQYPVTIDPMVQSVKLTSNLALCTLGGVCSAGNAGDNFGYSVSVSSDGNTLAVAAPFATGTNTGSGAVYVFAKPKNGWGNCIVVGCNNYVAKITPGIPGQVTQSGFGLSVSLSGDASTLAVLLDTPPPSTNSGAGIIYVYTKPSSGWASTGTQNAILSLYGPTEEPCTGADPNQNDCVTEFFSSVSVNGNGSIIVLGYAGAVVNSQSNGAAYVFVEPSGGWVSSYTPVKLTASDGAHLDLLGNT